jgi:hypothetical protein
LFVAYFFFATFFFAVFFAAFFFVAMLDLTSFRRPPRAAVRVDVTDEYKVVPRRVKMENRDREARRLTER